MKIKHIKAKTPCRFCRRKYDNTKSFYENAIEIANGPWVGLRANIDEEGRPYMYAVGDDYTERYYPKFCPECGRALPEFELNERS